MYAIALPRLLSGSARGCCAQPRIASTIDVDCSRRSWARSACSGPDPVASEETRAGTRALDAVELADELQDLRAGCRVVRLRLDELASHVRPAMGQREARARASERVVGAVPIGQDDAVITVEHPKIGRAHV